MRYSIELKDLVKADIYSIDFILENCEVITVFESEIVDMEIECEPNLYDMGSYITRVVKGGFIKLKLDDKYKFCRSEDFVTCGRAKRNKYQIVDRLKKVCDICRFEVHYKGCEERSEYFEVPYYEEEDEDTGYFIELITCSSCMGEGGRNIKILMGSESKYIPDRD